MPDQSSSGDSDDPPLANVARALIDSARAGDRQATQNFAEQIVRQIDSREASQSHPYQAPPTTQPQATMAHYARSSPAGQQPTGPARGQQPTGPTISEEIARRVVAQQIRAATSRGRK